jgi:hypothetical protein
MAVPATFRRPGHQNAEAAKGRLNQRQARLCCKSCRASDRDYYGILHRKAAGTQGTRGTRGMVHVSAAAAAQVGLHNGARCQWNGIYQRPRNHIQYGCSGTGVERCAAVG